MNLHNKPIYYSEGGLGDTLQHLPIMLQHKKYDYCLMNHYRGAPEFLRHFGIKPKYSFVYKTDEEKLEHLKNMNLKEPMVSCIRLKYFRENPFEKQKPLFDNGRPTVGLHLCGSKFSTDNYIKHGAITKTIPADIIFALGHYNIIVFGLPEEISRLNIKPSSNLKFISYLDPYKSLSYVEQCNAVVAADSSIKTMSSMLKIPTFVWLSDQSDHFRDTVFINPYVDDGIMKIYKYKNAAAEFKTAMDLTHDFLREVL